MFGWLDLHAIVCSSKTPACRAGGSSDLSDVKRATKRTGLSAGGGFHFADVLFL